MEILDNKLNSKKEEKRVSEEERVIEKIKTDSKAFYRYVKSKSVIRTKIGPLKHNGKLTDNIKEMCDILSNQYENICSVPRDDITSKEFIETLINKNDTIENSPEIRDIVVDYESVKKIITKLSLYSAMGPDGLPVNVFKHGCEIIIEAIIDITKESVKEKFLNS